jgi:hypothetical protein
MKERKITVYCPRLKEFSSNFRNEREKKTTVYCPRLKEFSSNFRNEREKNYCTLPEIKGIFFKYSNRKKERNISVYCPRLKEFSSNFRIEREKKSTIYLEKACTEIMEFHRTGCYDLMYMKTKEVGWKEPRRFKILASKTLRGIE